MIRMLKRLKRAESGAVMMLVAIGLPVLLAVVALAFSTAQQVRFKARAVNALDEATLATAAARAADPTAFAREYFLSNLGQATGDFTLNSLNVTVNATQTEWVGTISGSLRNSFASYLGVVSTQVTHTAKVTWDSSTTDEVVAMVDVSGTMCANFVRNTSGGNTTVDFVPDTGCTKLVMVSTALEQIAQLGLGYSESGPVSRPAYKVGVIPFSYKIKVANPGAVPAALYSNDPQNAAYFSNLSDAEGGGTYPLPAVFPLRTIASAADKNAVVSFAQSLRSNLSQAFQRPAWKRSALAAEASGMMLDPRFYSMYGGEAPSAFGAPHVRKRLIMMTDSANLGCCFTNWPAGNFGNHYIYSYLSDHQHLAGTGGADTGVCQQMKDAGIEIYTLLLDVNPSDVDARGGEIIQAFNNCATDSKHAFNIPPGDLEALKQAYTIIGKDLIKLRLVE